MFLQPVSANWSFPFRSAGFALALIVLGGGLEVSQAQSRFTQQEASSSVPNEAAEGVKRAGQATAGYGVREVYESVAQGGVYRFTFDFRGGTRVRLPGRRTGEADTLFASEMTSAFEIQIQGTWEMKVYRWGGGDAALVGWTAPSAQVEIRRQVEGFPTGRVPNEDSLEAGLAREVLVRIAPSGKVDRLLFPEHLPALVGSFWRQWADQALLCLPADGEGTQWRVEGQGPIGHFRDQYRRAGPRELVRERERYISLNGRFPTEAKSNTVQRSDLPGLHVEGKSRYQVHPKRGYLGTGNGTLVVKSPLAGDEQGEVLIARFFRFASSSFEQREGAALRKELLEKHEVDGLADLQNVLRPAPLDGRPEKEPAPGQKADGPLTPWSGLLNDLEQSVKAGASGRASALRRQLSRHLVRDPERIEKVAGRLGAQKTSARFRGVLFTALSEAGTPEAQAVIAKWIGARGGPETTRQALFSLSYVDNPSEALYDQVHQLSKDEGASSKVRHEAVRMVGVLAGRRQRKSSEEGADELFDLLQRLALSGEAPAMRRAAAHALGNTRLPSAVEHLREVARQAGPTASVAEAVIAALENVPGPESTRVLIDLAEKYPSPPVFQNRIISALTEKYESGREVQRERIHRHLAATLQEGKPTKLRLQVLGHYIGRLRQPSGEQAWRTVKRAAESNTSEKVRSRAQQALEALPPVAEFDSAPKTDQERGSSKMSDQVALTLMPRAGLFLSGTGSFWDIAGEVSSSLSDKQSVFTWGASLAFGSRDGPANFRLTGLRTTGSLASTPGGRASASAVPNKMLALTGDVVVRPVPRFLVQPYGIGGAGTRRLTISQAQGAGTEARWDAALQVGLGVDLRIGNTTLGAEVVDYLTGFGRSDQGLQHDAFLFLTFGIPLR